MQITTLITGSTGMVGSALRRLYKDFPKHKNHILLTPNKDELDLENKESVEEYFNMNKIDRVFHAAAKVGGIKANIDYPADFITSNLNINSNNIYFSIWKKTKNWGSSTLFKKTENLDFERGDYNIPNNWEKIFYKELEFPSNQISLGYKIK